MVAEGSVGSLRDASERLIGGCQQLEAIARQVQSLAERPAFGLFGTAIAATWLDAQTGQAARFFVDEDTNRIGRTHLGRPYWHRRPCHQGRCLSPCRNRSRVRWRHGCARLTDDRVVLP
jgi:hypothetical protein